MATLTPTTKKHKVTVVGSGNWGSAIAKIVAENTAAHPDLFERNVQMWVYEEEVTISTDSKQYNASDSFCTSPQKLTELINHFHENVKYLPTVPLPHNLIANPDLESSVQGSTILVFNLPHQFIGRICTQLQGKIVPYARGISCIKGVDVSVEHGIRLFSDSIGDKLGIYVGALSGANIANEVAQEKWSETTVAYDPPAMDSQHPTPEHSPHVSPAPSNIDLKKMAERGKEAAELMRGKKPGLPMGRPRLTPLPSEYPHLSHENMKKLFHRPYFHVRLTNDVAGVSLGGALKNVVALAAGWVDGLGWGDNAKAAVMRVGLLEEVKFGERFFSGNVQARTFTEESCGVADMITSCSGGRNFRCAKMSVERGEKIEVVEERELNGQKLQGTSTAYEVNAFLKSQNAEAEFPLFTAVYRILDGKAKAEDIPKLIEERPSGEANGNAKAAR